MGRSNAWAGRLLALLLSVTVVACAGPIGFQDAATREAALSAFRSGRGQLTCGTPNGCLLNWIKTRPAAARLMQAQRWDDLADVVLAANFDQDLAWFYLGLAASGLGLNDTARGYLDRSIQRSLIGGLQSCRPDQCDGINLPTDAQNVMASLRTPPTPARRRVLRRAAPRAGAVGPARVQGAQPAPGSPNWVAPVDTPE